MLRHQLNSDTDCQILAEWAKATAIHTRAELQASSRLIAEPAQHLERIAEEVIC